MSNWIQTFTGRAVEPGAFTADMVSPLDIAHALSNICRYTGHVSRFYSVAEHSVLVARLVREMSLPGLLTDALRGRLVRTDRGQAVAHGLMHDASEAYLADVAAPVKHLPEFSDYRVLESRVQGVIESAFGIRAVNVTLKDGRTVSSVDLVKEADLIVLKFEAARLMLPPPKSWGLPETPPWQAFITLAESSPGLRPEDARAAFMMMLSDLAMETQRW